MRALYLLCTLLVVLQAANGNSLNILAWDLNDILFLSRPRARSYFINIQGLIVWVSSLCITLKLISGENGRSATGFPHNPRIWYQVWSGSNQYKIYLDDNLLVNLVGCVFTSWQQVPCFCLYTAYSICVSAMQLCLQKSAELIISCSCLVCSRFLF